MVGVLERADYTAVHKLGNRSMVEVAASHYWVWYDTGVMLAWDSRSMVEVAASHYWVWSDTGRHAGLRQQIYGRGGSESLLSVIWYWPSCWPEIMWICCDVTCSKRWRNARCVQSRLSTEWVPCLPVSDSYHLLFVCFLSLSTMSACVHTICYLFA